VLKSELSVERAVSELWRSVNRLSTASTDKTCAWNSEPTINYSLTAESFMVILEGNVTLDTLD